MNLNETQLAYIQQVVATAKLIKSDSVVIESNMVRAIDINQTAFILQTEGIPEFEFDAIALGSINTFTSRLDLVQLLPNFSVEVIVKDFVRSLKMKGNKTTVDYRCSSPSLIRSPRKVPEPPKYIINITPDTVSLLQKSINAMKADSVIIKSDNSGATFIIEDINNDKFEHLFSPEVNNIIDDEPAFFSFKYPIKTILSLFQQDIFEFSITENGFLCVVINGLHIYVLPEVEV